MNYERSAIGRGTRSLALKLCRLAPALAAGIGYYLFAPNMLYVALTVLAGVGLGAAADWLLFAEGHRSRIRGIVADRRKRHDAVALANIGFGLLSLVIFAANRDVSLLLGFVVFFGGGMYLALRPWIWR